MSSQSTKGAEKLAPRDEHHSFELKNFFPYVARVFYTEVSGAVFHLYGKQYNMRRDEWRAMAVLGQHCRLTASDIADLSSMDKVQVSRAIGALRTKGWLIERANKQDGRSRVLALSPTGLKVFHALVPRMMALEAELLAGISEEELDMFKDLMARVTGNAKHLTEIYADVD